jgi:hypothetical protein
MPREVKDSSLRLFVCHHKEWEVVSKREENLPDRLNTGLGVQRRSVEVLENRTLKRKSCKEDTEPGAE